jgi:cytoskeletal protein CcmA (bactofilin family)
LRRAGIGCDAPPNPRRRSVQMCVRRAVRVVTVALLALLVGPASASAATDHVVITGGAVVPAGRTAGDVVVLDGTVRIAGRATGDVVSVSGPLRVTGRVDGDLITVSDRAFLGPTARVGGDLRYGDERPLLARGARVGGEISNEDWADAASGWGWVSLIGWWLAVSVSTLIVGVLMVLLAPAALYAAERAVRERLGATVAWGVAIAIGVPLLAVLALVTLVGIPFGIALLLTAIPVLVVAYTTSAWIVGRRVLRDRSTSPWAALFIGWGILRVLALIPVAGVLVGLVATVVGLGALAVALWRAGRPGAPAARPGAPPPGRPAPAA